MTTWQRVLWLTSVMAIACAPAAWAEGIDRTISIAGSEDDSTPEVAGHSGPVSTTVAGWIAQLRGDQYAQASAEITGVQVQAVEAGLEVILESQANLPAPVTSVVGNAVGPWS